ncbi:hypothetical protein CXF61_08235 [Psychrobacter sp. 4Dc]|nr:hypothetical protein CXF61_08235 [Psychrobacter sp. 4Dc]
MRNDDSLIIFQIQLKVDKAMKRLSIVIKRQGMVRMILCLYKDKLKEDYNVTRYIKLQKRCWSHTPASSYKTILFNKQRYLPNI